MREINSSSIQVVKNCRPHNWGEIVYSDSNGTTKKYSVCSDCGYYQQTLSKIVSIDYDDTIVFSDYPNSGEIKQNAKEAINRLYDSGITILIWTCRSGEALKTAENYLRDIGVKFHHINENLPSIVNDWGGDTRKMWADIYIDDKQLGGLPESWLDIEDMIYKQLKIEKK